MLILAVDCSRAIASCALMKNGSLVLERDMAMYHSQSQHLLPFIDDLLAEHHYATSDIDVFAFTKGPGYFLSVRVCAAMLMGAAFVLSRPIVPLSSFVCVAEYVRQLHGLTSMKIALALSSTTVTLATCVQLPTGWVYTIDPHVQTQADYERLLSEPAQEKIWFFDFSAQGSDTYVSFAAILACLAHQAVRDHHEQLPAESIYFEYGMGTQFRRYQA